MQTTEQLSVTLPQELAAQVRARVASGAYADESEVVREGLRELLERDLAVEEWLRSDVAAAYDGLRDDPLLVRSVAEVRATLAAERKRASGLG